MALPRQDEFESRRPWARAQDQTDPLSSLRSRFALPRGADGQPLLYLSGHSLGLAPIGARAMIDAEIEDWERLAVLGHEQARSPWIGYAEQLQPELARLSGALPLEVVAMNSLSVNLHLLLASFYRPNRQRSAILIEAGAFSSDHHVVAAQIAWHGLDPARELIELAPRPGEELLRSEDIEQRIAASGSGLALVLWPGVQYRTGQYFDLPRIIRAAHAAGAAVGLDLAHAIRSRPAVRDSLWCSGPACNTAPGNTSICRASSAPHTRPAQLSGSTWPTRSATCHWHFTTMAPTSPPGAATSISMAALARSAARSSTNGISSVPICLGSPAGGATSRRRVSRCAPNSLRPPGRRAGPSATRRFFRPRRYVPRCPCLPRRVCRRCATNPWR